MADGNQSRRAEHSEAVSNLMIAQMQEGVLPWRKSLIWDGKAVVGGRPHNPITKCTYRGCNYLYLKAIQPDGDPRWMTLKQANTKGWRIKKGSKRTQIEYWVFDKEVVDPATGVKTKVKLDHPYPFYSYVFHASQIEGIPAYVPPTPRWDPHERAEQLIKATGAYIIERAGDAAFYSPAADHIVIPERPQFQSMEAWASTVLHEIGHWTGHKSRLDRDLSGSFASDSYAKEELRAELVSVMLCMELGIPYENNQHASYLQHWLKILKDDNREIFRAAAEAERMMSYILAFEQQKEQDHTEAEQVEAPESHEPSEPIAAMALPPIAEPESDSIFRLSTQERAERKTWEAEALRDIQAHHDRSVRGYSPLETWQNLSEHAAKFGLIASVAHSNHFVDPTVDDLWTIHYLHQDGTFAPIRTLFGPDGKALTEIYGERVPDSRYTVDHESQRFDLQYGVAVDYHLQQPIQLTAFEMSQTGMNPVAVLRDVVGILKGEHTGYRSGSPSSNAEAYMRDLAEQRPEKAWSVAKHWCEHLDPHSLRTSLSQSEVYALGRQLEVFADRARFAHKEAQEEHAQ